jgi:hypothetical protein
VQKHGISSDRYPANGLRIQWPNRVQVGHMPVKPHREAAGPGDVGSGDGCRMPSTPEEAAIPSRGTKEAVA